MLELIIYGQNKFLTLFLNCLVYRGTYTKLTSLY